MKITVLRVTPGDSDSCSDGKTCPALAHTETGSYVVVGRVVTDPEALGALGIGPGEMAVEVPAPLLDER
jgi:hypothetical protein